MTTKELVSLVTWIPKPTALGFLGEEISVYCLLMELKVVNSYLPKSERDSLLVSKYLWSTGIEASGQRVSCYLPRVRYTKRKEPLVEGALEYKNGRGYAATTLGAV